MISKIRIKDIAKMAGVSVGTVDRVLHNRPNISKVAREKVEKVLEQINYQPNMYASALAYNKSYTFYLVVPQHESEAYWEEIEEGAMKATEARRDFHVTTKIIYYDRFNADSFLEQANACLDLCPDGVIVVPSQLEYTRQFTDKLHERHIPFVMLDSYLPGLQPLSFYGQDSLASGYFAAKMLMMVAHGEEEIVIVKQTKDGKVVSKQQENREMGFKNYMHDHFPHIKITDVNLPLETGRHKYADILEAFFNNNPQVHHCITFNSKAHIVGDFLLQTNRRDIQIMGYDMVGKNAECLKRGSISFLIAQHAYMQGYACVETLFQSIVLKKQVAPINYMPIELLTKENVAFYRRTQL